VELYQVTDGGHAWPGGTAGRRRANAPSDAIDATTAMWEFFKAHPRR
jgi:polyhydroxybutyrate depolymerase